MSAVARSRAPDFAFDFGDGGGCTIAADPRGGEMEGLEDAFRFHGHDVIDHAGQRVGVVSALYLDAVTEQARWATIAVDDPERGETFVPLGGASADGADLRLAYGKEHVVQAPQTALQS
jgi:hypothetical protein